MTRLDTGLTLPGTPEAPAPKGPAAVAELLAQAGDIADRTERANRPVTLIYLALVLLGLSLLVMISYAYTRQAALSHLRFEAERTARIEKLVAKMKEYDRINEERREELRPLPTLQTPISEAATQAQLKTHLNPGQVATAKGPGDLTRRTWRYNDLHEDDLAKVFDWISRCLRSVPGLELTGLTLRPEAQAWKVDVVFGRWERISS
jgi:hypothetical protein